MKISKAINLALAMLLLAACGKQPGSEACISGRGKSEVLDIMQDWYLWNDEAEQFDKYQNIDLSQFADTNALLDFLRYRPEEFDRGFSYITTPEEEASFFDEGQFVGFGFGLSLLGENELYINRIFADSPAATAGFERGFRVLAINGRTIAEIGVEGLAAALGPDEAGFSATFTVTDTSGTELPPIELVKSVVTIDSVSEVTVLQDGSGNDVGYLLFETFISPASAELREAFTQFNEQSIRNIVIDLRYNGGGLVSVSEVLASLLAGDGNVGNVYSMTTFNSARAAEFNETSSFQEEDAALTLDKIVFITSDGSASASEMVINGLEPYFADENLALVGSTTFGKPVGQFAFDFCGETRRLRAVTFKTVNALGSGEYFSGLPVDCEADDDVFAPLGDASENSLAAALAYIGTGSCPLTSMAPGFNISRAGGAVKARPLSGPGIAQQHAGAF